MNMKIVKYIAFGIITFVIVFLMNYVGSELPDRLSRALMTAFAAVVGLGIGLWFYKKNGKDDHHPDFD